MNKKHPDEFKQEAVRQVVEKGYSVTNVFKRLSISDKSSITGLVGRKYLPANPQSRKKYANLGQLTEERNILKEAAM